jgi:predicted dehydrogenase
MVSSPTEWRQARIRYAIVGTGSRADTYIRAIVEDYADVADLRVLSDPNPGRLDVYEDFLRAREADRHVPVARGDPTDLERFLHEEAIDRVLITSPDHTHAEYVVRSLRSGADVIVEKPLTIDAAGARAIIEGVRATGRGVVVTFNYRYAPRNSALRRLIQSGAIGTVTSIHFEWLLDTNHGADYFRRWHRDKANSGGLLVHKASHHFDLVNWWIDDIAIRVFASGGLRFYGDRNAAARGIGERPERGTHDDPHDPFELDLRGDEQLRRLYLENERHDGYIRDRDVFSTGISIEDNMAVVVDYARGATLSYSLNAHAPWEGYRVAVNGTEGRAELDVVDRPAVVLDADKRVIDPNVPSTRREGGDRITGDRLVVQRHWDQARKIEIPSLDGGHAGGDPMLLGDLFRGPVRDDLGRSASYLDGLRSVVIGIAANRSMETGQPVNIDELGLELDLGRLP